MPTPLYHYPASQRSFLHTVSDQLHRNLKHIVAPARETADIRNLQLQFQSTLVFKQIAAMRLINTLPEFE